MDQDDVSSLGPDKEPFRPVSRSELLAAATAIANARAGRRGIAPIPNVLQRLRPFGGGQLYAEVMEDAEAALLAVNRYWAAIKTGLQGRVGRSANAGSPQQSPDAASMIAGTGVPTFQEKGELC